MSTLWRILLVDDDEVDRMAVLRFVRREQLPYRLETASSCSAAVARLAQSAFDLILLDYQLGDGTGLEVLSEIGSIPVIFVTGKGNEEIAVQAMHSGACDYLVATNHTVRCFH